MNYCAQEFALHLSALKDDTWSKDKPKLLKVSSIIVNIPNAVSSGFSTKLISLLTISFLRLKYCTAIENED